MGVARHKPADSNLRKWAWIRAYLHGHGYHMSTDSNLRKWAWIRAFVHTYTLMNGRGYHVYRL